MSREIILLSITKDELETLIINSVNACLKFHSPEQKESTALPDIGFCNSCGNQLAEIRGRFPKQPKRIACPCCVTEEFEKLKSGKKGPVSNKNG